VSPAGFLLAGLIGAWLAHDLEYFRVWGASGFPTALSRSAHLYMGPAGVLLIVFALAAAQISFRAVRRMERRLSQLRGALAGGRNAVDNEIPHGALTFTWTTLLGVLWLSQLVLYLAQENLEARALGLPLPWLGAMNGIHALAPAVHLAVACLVAAAVWLLRRKITQRTAEVRRLATFLAARRRATVQAVCRQVTRWWTPAERWGVQLWGRPPPASASA